MYTFHSALNDLRERATSIAKSLHPVFVAMGWTWHDTGSPEVPSVERIARHVVTLCDHATPDNPSGGSGRVRLTIYRNILGEWVGRVGIDVDTVVCSDGAYSPITGMEIKS